MTKRTLRLSLMAATVLILPGVSPAAGQSEAPLESQAPLEPMAASYWTGTWTGTGGEPGTQTQRTGYFEDLGGIAYGTVMADDPRVVGTWTQVNNIHLAPAQVGQGDFLIMHGTARIDNDEGAWVGTFTAFGGGGAGFGEEWYVMEGEGAYEGLTTVFRFRGSDGTFEGVILPAELPALPDPVAPPTE